MTKTFILPIAAVGLTLCGCNQSSADRLGDRVENAAEVRADAMEANAAMMRNQAAALDNRADRTRDVAELRAEAIRAADRNVAAMTQEQRDAIVANQAAAVR